MGSIWELDEKEMKKGERGGEHSRHLCCLPARADSKDDDIE